MIRKCFQRNERVESALGGYEMTKYIPPVVRLEEDEELEDVLPQQEDGLESEDMFDQFFSSQGKILYKMKRYIPLVVRLEDGGVRK